MTEQIENYSKDKHKKPQSNLNATKQIAKPRATRKNSQLARTGCYLTTTPFPKR